MNKIYVYVLLAVIAIAGCKTRKDASLSKTPPAVKKLEPSVASPQAILLNTAAANANTFTFYKSRGTANYRDAKTQIELEVEITMEKNSYIMLSAKAVLGIEVTRVLLTKDTISILDRMNRKHIVTDYRYIEKLTNTKLSLSQLQQLFIGNPLFTPSDSNSSVDSILNYIVVNSLVSPTHTQVLYLRQSTVKPTRNLITDKSNGREFKTEYDEFHIHGSNMYPSDFTINIRAEKSVECRFTLNYFAFVKEKELNFVVPKNYQTLRM
jgi:hypothetical protein